MAEVLCPTCGSRLFQKEKNWHCENGHGFDVARQGYVNLLTAGMKHSRHPGDTKQMVAARRAFLDAGYYMPIADRLCQVLSRYQPDCRSVLDAGCGEGYYLAQVGRMFDQAELWGLDISKDAVRYAAARNRQAHWVAGTAARLPFADAQFSCVLSMFALTVPEEFSRVLQPDGIFVQFLAGGAHLMGLKQIIYPQILRKEKDLQPELAGFRRIHSEEVSFSFALDSPQQVQNLLAMTPHLWRISKEGAARLAQTQCLTDRAEVVVNVYCKK